MESKYYDRAEQILFKERGVSINVDGDCLEHNSIFIEAMCQLVEEVEREIGIELNDVMREEGIWTKNQVEELLQKQRELCAENALCDMGDMINKDSILFFTLINLIYA
jgi:hypothetical protein